MAKKWSAISLIQAPAPREALIALPEDTEEGARLFAAFPECLGEPEGVVSFDLFNECVARLKLSDPENTLVYEEACQELGIPYLRVAFPDTDSLQHAADELYVGILPVEWRDTPRNQGDLFPWKGTDYRIVEFDTGMPVLIVAPAACFA